MRAKLIDVDNRLSIKYDKTEGIYQWGDDNAYPSLVKSLIGSSVTAKNCVDINAKYLYGKGFSFDGKNKIVNKDGLTINQLLRIVSKEFSEINNIFLHVNWNSAFEITTVELFQSTEIRIGKTDSTSYAGKFLKYNNWDKKISKSINAEDYTFINRFNPNPQIIQAQVDAAGGWSKYKGQILHIKGDFSSLYSLSDADSVLMDCDSEFQASVFKNAGLRKGFFGNKLIVTKPFNSDEERDDFENELQDFIGAENRGIMLLSAELQSDVLADQFIIQDIDSNINDKMFEYTESSTAKNIRKAFGVPAILLEDSDNSIFGNSGELLKQAKTMHWENKEEERNIISEAFQAIFRRWHEPINQNNDWSIIPIITLESNATPNDPAN